MSERFSMKELMKNDNKEKNLKTTRATKRAQKKGKYTIRIVDGIKYMTLD